VRPCSSTFLFNKCAVVRLLRWVVGVFYDSTINFFFFLFLRLYSVFQAINCTYFSFESVKTTVSDILLCSLEKRDLLTRQKMEENPKTRISMLGPVSRSI